MFWGETDRNHLGYVIENILHRSHPPPASAPWWIRLYMYTFSILFSFDTPSLGPLTLRNKPAHSLTHSLTAHSCYVPLTLFFPSYHTIKFRSTMKPFWVRILTDGFWWSTGVGAPRRTFDWIVSPQPPRSFHMGSTSHIWGYRWGRKVCVSGRGGQGLLICAIDLLLVR